MLNQAIQRMRSTISRAALSLHLASVRRIAKNPRASSQRREQFSPIHGTIPVLLTICLRHKFCLLKMKG